LDVGARLKTIRKLKGLSQRELAKRAGVTNSTISMIEKNSVSPSVSSLKKVLSGIPMSLVDFFSLELEQDSQRQVIYRADELLDIGSNEVTMKLVGKGHPNRAFAFSSTRPTHPAPIPARTCSTTKAKKPAPWSAANWRSPSAARSMCWRPVTATTSTAASRTASAIPLTSPVC